MEAAGFFKHWFLCMEIYDVKSKITVLSTAGKNLKDCGYFMHIHSQIMLGKSLSAKRKSYVKACTSRILSVVACLKYS
jgi:hypothetical protein